MTTRAALTTIDIISRDRLPKRAGMLEALIRTRVAWLASTEPALLGVRGKGLLLALEIDRAKLPVGDDEIAQALFDQGISTTLKGQDAIGFSPPMTITDEEVETALLRITMALSYMRSTA
ncbi:aminotransferase class III-fold pyridoxal phosphate-dependent enzyme [Rhizobium rhizogenes]|uniref:Aminotransferase class III-fold pyridoxal phosphate-dependent enzyme n=1 Tax=Rhizobium rhizogenes TaxID=359 RepID=A0AA88JR92_RHIRH|nr:aminotransferase class III-fold pyridoxal phosphate-dependent enzyme [Rhizobium rhizogenes]